MSQSIEPGSRPPATASLEAEACTLVIFGGSGDLSQRKLMPALYNLALDGVLPEKLAIVGIGRRELGDEGFRTFVREGLEKFSRRAVDTECWPRLEAATYYHEGTLDDPKSYEVLKRRLEEIELESGLPGNRIFYLSIPPSLFGTCIEQLQSAGLARPDGERGPKTRIIVEKPIGRDLASARSLNTMLSGVFEEQQIYRIDHYLGKETVQNILVMRFGNAIFEPLWNQKYVDHVQITVSEEVGVGTRAGYYEEAGALRDMMQNHILQLLSLVAMEPPWSLAPDVVRDHKLEVLKCLRPITGEDVSRYVVRAQYGHGFDDSGPVPGYRQEDRVARASTTETYVALKVFIDNWRWAGVPFYIRTGKRMARRTSEISVQFKEVPHILFNANWESPLDANVLTLKIQPDEGLSLCISAKLPGSKVQVKPVDMEFRYGDCFGDQSPEAYERLLLDVMCGDATLYMRRDAVEASWVWIDPILKAWEASPARWLPEYDAGSWGPVEADRLIEAGGSRWRNK